MRKPGIKRQSFRGPLGFALALAVAIPGAMVFSALNVPLAWMLGPMVFCTLASLAGLPLYGYPRLRPLVLSAVGIAIASGVTSDTPADLVHMAPSLVGLFLCTALSAAVSILFCLRIARFDLRTAVFSGMPGGLAEMVTLSEHYGADIRRVSLFHSGRLLFIVLCLPVLMTLGGGLETSTFINDAAVRIAELSLKEISVLVAIGVVGAIAGRLIKLPAGHLTGPLLLTAIVRGTETFDVVLPQEPLMLAQLVIGTVTGAGFAGMPIRELLRALGLAFASSMILIVILVVFALTVSTLLDQDFRILVLSYSQGGMSESSILAMTLSAEVTVVALHHVSRLLFVLFGVALVLRIMGVAPLRSPPSRGDGGDGA